MNGIYLLLGSNLGNRLENLRQASQKIKRANIQIVRHSEVYESSPWGDTQQDWFLNCVLETRTDLPPDNLLTTLLNIESEMGRVRLGKWGARIIDIDILYFNNQVVQLPELTIPHPEIPNRKFTLVPLTELCPNEINPITSLTHSSMLKTCPDTGQVHLSLNNLDVAT